MLFTDNTRPDPLWYWISIPRFPPRQHPLPAAWSTCSRCCCWAQLHPRPHPRFGSSLVRGPKRYLQLFPGHCLNIPVVCYFLPPSSPLYTCPLFPAPFPKVLFLFHLAAPFLNRLTTTRQGEKPAWLLPPSLPKQMLPADPVVPCKPGWGVSASAVPWCGGTGLSAMRVLKPCQQPRPRLPSQPTAAGWEVGCRWGVAWSCRYGGFLGSPKSLIWTGLCIWQKLSFKPST